jgi:hypothetical protein
VDQTIIDLLRAALTDGRLVRIYRSVEDHAERGHVLAVGDSFVAVAAVDDRQRYDGIHCLRLQDVRTVETDPYADFAEAALTARGEVRPELGEVSLLNVTSLLLTASAAHPLITVHPEVEDPDVCFIGKVLSLEGGLLWLREIGPDAVWDDEPEAHRISEITRVDFGGDYEQALALIGGAPPEKTATPAGPRLRLVADNS